MFTYPKFNETGTQILSAISGVNKEMMMDVSIHRLQQGEEFLVEEQEVETAILLLRGKIQLEYEQNLYQVSRTSVFSEMPTCLHLSSGKTAIIMALESSEVLIQSAHNDREFRTRLYLPQDMSKMTSSEKVWEGVVQRDFITIFDYYNAPYSNMVLGEMLIPQGRWASYIPYCHAHPEMHYYKFPSSEGFGACFVGDKVYTIRDESCGAFLDNESRNKVTAPGYPMYCCWMIRHLEGSPWKRTRIDDKRYTHLLR